MMRRNGFRSVCDGPFPWFASIASEKGGGRDIDARARQSIRFGLQTVLLICAVGWAAPGRAQVPVLLQRPNVDIVDGGAVYASVRLADGSSVVGGRFEQVNGVVRGSVFKRRPDGTLDPDWNPSVDGIVYAVAADAAGNVYAGGFFSVAGEPKRHRLIKLSGSGAGAIDAEWNPAPNARVSALAADAEGNVYAGGSFSSIGGQRRAGLAKLSGSASGTADPDWNPAPNGDVAAIALDAAGNVFIGGSFSLIGGQSRTNIAKLAGSGAVDPAWNPTVCPLSALALDASGHLFAGGGYCLVKLSVSGSGAVDPSWNPPPVDDEVLAVAADADGNVYAGGLFTTIGGVPRASVAKLSSAGVVDPSWNPSTDGLVEAIGVDADGKVHFGGDFETVAGSTRLSFAVASPTGTLESAMDAEVHGIVGLLAQQPDGGTVVGGTFYKADGHPRRHLLRLRADGSVDPDWNPSADRSIWALATDSAGDVYVGGDFAAVGGQPRQGIAKLSGGGTGTADANWKPILGGGRLREVSTLTISATDDLYVAGYFDSVDGVPRRNFVKLSTDGAAVIDPNWDPSPDVQVNAMALDAAGNLYVGGIFDRIGGLSRAHIAKLSAAGVVDPDWHPSADDRVTALTVDAAGDVFVGGEFGTIGGQPRQRIAKLSGSGNGVVDADWNPAANDRVDVLAIDATGDVYAGGRFTAIGGQPRTHIAKLAATGAGAVAPGWNPVVGEADNVLTGVRDLKIDAEGHVWAVGAFMAVDGQPRKGIAVFGQAPDFLFVDGFESAPGALAEAEG